MHWIKYGPYRIQKGWWRWGLQRHKMPPEWYILIRLGFFGINAYRQLNSRRHAL